MKIFQSVCCLGVAFLLFTACHTSTEQKQYEAEWPNAVTYEIFVQSFADSDGDGIGDINGMTQKLGYLQELGVKAVWLMPISPSPSYHKYDVTDYYGIHPDYGSMDDFRNFVDKAHEHGIRVVIDLVINHTARDHEWFRESMKGKDNPFRDWYVWAKKEEVQDELNKKEVHFDSDNINQWHEAPGNDEVYYGYFWGGMPDLNFDNQQVKDEIFKIGRFWLEEVNVDGFRLDAARHIFPDDRAEDNHAFWVEFREEMQKVKPDVYTIGEIWANMETTAPYAKGFSSFFNFDLAFSILQSINKGENIATAISHTSYDERKGVSLADALQLSRDTFLSLNPDFYDATFLTNHDQNRLMDVLGKDINKARLAAAVLMSLPGTPYLYYGEEIGMLGSKPDPEIREPFLWDVAEKDKYRASWIEPKNTNDQTVTPLAMQQKDDNSLYHHYKTLIGIRNNSEALSVGEIVPVEETNHALLSFWRVSENETVWVLHNFSDEEISLPFSHNYNKVLYKHKATLKQAMLSLPARSSIFIQL